MRYCFLPMINRPGVARAVSTETAVYYIYALIGEERSAVTARAQRYALSQYSLLQSLRLLASFIYLQLDSTP